VFSLEADPALTLPRVARTFVRGCSKMLGSVATETVLLLTSEMVTNSVQHAQTERVHVTLQRIGSSLRIEVADEDPERPVLRDRDDARIGGLGLQMVARMASAWGVEPEEPVGKRVWFEVDAT